MTRDSEGSGGVGRWEPAKDIHPDPALLERFARIGGATPEEPAASLSEEEIRRFAPLMRLGAKDWSAVLESLEDVALVDLVRFFTVAEMKLAGWDAGERSPVIYCVRELRKRGCYPADLTAWIKAHTDNRFLPYGSLLDRL